MSDPLIFATFLAPTCYKTYQYIIEYIERYIKVPAFLLNGETLEDFAAAFVDVGFISPFSYVQLLNLRPCPVELLAASIALGASDQDEPPVYFSVVVRQDSSSTSLPELEECVWADYTGSSHTGGHSLSALSMPTGHKSIEAPTAARALRLVLAGKADATAIDVRSLSIAFHNSRRMAAGLRILEVLSASSPLTTPVAVVAAHVPLPMRLRLQMAFASLYRDPFFAQYLHEEAIARFMPLTNLHYQRIPNPAEQDIMLHHYSQQNTVRHAHLTSWTASVPG